MLQKTKCRPAVIWLIFGGVLIGFAIPSDASDPKRIAIHVRNTTGQVATGFHMAFAGDIRAGTALAWRTDSSDIIGTRWARDARQTTIVYNDPNNETIVSWQDPDDPVQPGDYMHFAFSRGLGGIRPVRTWWTSADSSPSPQAFLPRLQTSLQVDSEQKRLRITLRSLADEDGSNEPEVTAYVSVRTTETPVLLTDLNLIEVTSLTLRQFVQLKPFTMEPNTTSEFDMPVSGRLTPGNAVIVQTHMTVDSDPNAINRLEVFDPPIPTSGCWDCLDQTEGDFNNDGEVNLTDFALLAAAYDDIAGAEDYNPCADPNRDSIVGLADLRIFSMNMTRTDLEVCEPVPPSEQDCCMAAESSSIVGCVDPLIQSCVCEEDAYCCGDSGGFWDELCVGEVEELGCGICAAPDQGDCCAEHSFPGCLDTAIRDCVCVTDSYCCDVGWDSLCATEVDLLSCGTCKTGCCEASQTPGCEDPAVEACVCAVDSYCCEVAWDDACIDTAFQVCGQCAP